MSSEKQIEEIKFTEVDLLANDLNQHCADLAENYCGGINCLSCLAHALTEKGYRKDSEVARKIFAEIENNTKFCISLIESMIFESEEIRKAKLECYRDCLGYYAELKKKYTKEE